MFTYQTSKPEKKWFLCQNDRLIDVSFFCEFHFETRPDNITVYGQFTSGNIEPIGYFKTKEEAKDYIKTLYDFLVA